MYRIIIAFLILVSTCYAQPSGRSVQQIQGNVRVTGLTNDTPIVVAIDQTGTNNGVSLVDPTIEQTTGATHNDLNIAVAGKDNAGKVKPLTQITTGSMTPLVVAVLDASGNQITSFGTDPVGLKNVALTTINPATEDTLSTMNAKFVSGTDVGDVTINNAAGSGAYVQPGTSTIWTAKTDQTTHGTTDKVAADVYEGGAAVSVSAPLHVQYSTMPTVTISPATSGGWSVMNATSGDSHTALTNSAQVIKASAGQLGGYYYYNPNSSAIYINVYNVAAASVTVGTTTALLNFCIPAASAANIELLAGVSFDTAISASATTTGGGNTAPTTALEVMFYYK